MMCQSDVPQNRGRSAHPQPGAAQEARGQRQPGVSPRPWDTFGYPGDTGCRGGSGRGCPGVGRGPGPAAASPCRSRARAPPGSKDGTGRTWAPGTASAGCSRSTCRPRSAAPTWRRRRAGTPPRRTPPPLRPCEGWAAPVPPRGPGWACGPSAAPRPWRSLSARPPPSPPAPLPARAASGDDDFR